MEGPACQRSLSTVRLCEGVACAQTRVRFLRPIGQPITGIGGQTRGDNGRDSADKVVVCTATRTYRPRVASRYQYHQRHVGPKRNAQDIRAENRMGGCRGAARRIGSWGDADALRLASHRSLGCAGPGRSCQQHPGGARMRRGRWVVRRRLKRTSRGLGLRRRGGKRVRRGTCSGDVR